MPLLECQLEGLPGPTHRFGGLSRGNLASEQHAGQVSNPRAGALQCLAKQRLVLELGLPAMMLPPLLRPDLRILRKAGFSGSDAEVIAAAARDEPALLSAVSSSAFMWCANAGTVIHERDGAGDRCRLAPANLLATPHRAIEASARARQLRRLLEPLVQVDPMLPPTMALADEGAANHTRLHGPDGRGVHLFVYGRDPSVAVQDLPTRNPARQTRAAQAAIVRRCGVAPSQVIYTRQTPQAIDAGAFHNDVVMVGASDRVFVHADALVEQSAVLAALRQRIPSLQVFEVSADDLSLDEAVACYLFNSLLVDTAAGWTLVAPIESSEGRPRQVIDRLREAGFVAQVHFVDLRESMDGGGGPACLRLRMPVTHGGLAAIPDALRLHSERIDALEQWVRAHYRDRLVPADLADPQLLDESRRAQSALADILGLSPELLHEEERMC